MSPHLMTLTRDALLIALAAGASSLITYRLTRPSTVPHAVRGTRFELVDGSGRLSAVVEPDDSKAPCLRFINRSGTTRLQLGLRFETEDPYVLMNAPDKTLGSNYPLIITEIPRWAWAITNGVECCSERGGRTSQPRGR